MEKQKSQIDEEADSLVRKELLGGLGYLVVSTAGLFRLTFWELSWDVMEPICYFVTSTYFMACYAFFLRTRTEPSFEGIFRSRFSAKQKRLMELHNFDVERYSELKKAFHPYSTRLPASPPQPYSSFDKSEKVQLGVAHDHWFYVIYSKWNEKRNSTHFCFNLSFPCHVLLPYREVYD